MATSAHDRFSNLFRDRPKPTAPERDKTHFSVIELEQSRNDHSAKPRSKPRALRDQSNSDSDLDEYVRTFAPIQRPQPRPRWRPEAGALGYDKDRHIEPLGQICYLPDGKWAMDEEDLDEATTVMDRNTWMEPGSSSEKSGTQFCLFSLVIKFPYKYMKDPDDRVSRRFFAGHKIFHRGWDL